MGCHIDVDMGDLSRFFGTVQQAAKGGFKDEMNTFLEGLGDEFLKCAVESFISHHKNTGSGDLVTSLSRGSHGNVWNKGDLELEVGTNLQYASYVNDGHSTSSTGEDRFVPGYWQGQRFIYDPGAKGGMMLHYHWVEGLHFWEEAEHKLSGEIDKMAQVKIQEWLDKYFGG